MVGQLVFPDVGYQSGKSADEGPWIEHEGARAIAPGAVISGGVILPHPQGIVVGHGAVIGARTWIFQNVTIGGAPGKAGSPRVGADVRIFAGAVIAGPISVGNNVIIGANVVVARDVHDRSLVRPADPIVVPLPDRFRTCDG